MSSRKRFDVRFGNSGKWRKSQGVVQGTCVPVDALKQSCWANMPPELLRRERSEDTWPSKKNVVSSAGTKFTVFDAQGTNPGAQSSSRLISLEQVSLRSQSGNYPVAHISREILEVNILVLGSRITKHKRTHCVMDAIPASAVEPGGTAPTQTELDNFVSFKSPSGQKEGVLVLKSKVPRWEGQSWCLYFNGRRDIVASGRNFQLVDAPENGPEGLENGNVIFQFAKVREDVFLMGYQYPISAFQAFTISLSRFRCEPCWTRFFLRRVVMNL